MALNLGTLQFNNEGKPLLVVPALGTDLRILQNLGTAECFQFDDEQVMVKSVTVGTGSLSVTVTVGQTSGTGVINSAAYASGTRLLPLTGVSGVVCTLFLAEGLTPVLLGPTISQAVNLPLSPIYIRRVNKASGVFSVNTLVGTVVIDPQDDQALLWSNDLTGSPKVQLHAVGFFSGKDITAPQALQTINGVTDSVQLAEETTIKFEASTALVTVSLPTQTNFVG